MSWGTNYRYDGFISRVGMNELEEKLEDTRLELAVIREELLTLMASSPPANGVVADEDGEKRPWHQYVARRMNILWTELEEFMSLSVRLRQALEVKKYEPENITEG